MMAITEPKATITAEPVYVPEELILIPLRKVPAAPVVRRPVYFEAEEKKRLVINIETTGFSPLNNRMICIGFQDPLVPEIPPSVLMYESEKAMLEGIFNVIKEGDYKEIIGYGLGFDTRFLLLKAMKHNVSCKEFYDCSLFDLMEIMAKGRKEYVYFPQKALKLSELADFFWGYPKPFSDVEMIKYYELGQFGKVLDFAASQINRTTALYLLFRNTTDITSRMSTQGTPANAISSQVNTPPENESLLTIPEAQPSKTWPAKCSNCLNEWQVPLNLKQVACPICHKIVRRP